MQVERVGELKLKLGENPWWDARGNALWVGDAIDQRIWRIDPADGQTQSWAFDAPVGSFCLSEDGRAIIALQNDIVLFDFATGQRTVINHVEADDPITQLNDGKVDRAGRFLTGTVATDFKSTNCGLYSVAQGAVSKLDGGFGMTNGPCWSPDGKTFYWAESSRMEIYAYDYDQETGLPSNRRLFASTAELGGIPDGATTDAEGRLYSGICGGGVVACWSADGKLVDTMKLPTAAVSSVMFGGPDLTTLFVTTIDTTALPFLTGQVADPQAGYIYAIKGLGAQGLEENRYKI